MYRQSSKGNPWHDARGRFTSNGNSGEKKAVKWSSFDDVQDVSALKKKDAQELDRNRTDKHLKDGKRFYHNKSITREKNAIAVASYTIPKGLSNEQRCKEINKAWNRFAKENAVALRKSGKIVQYRKGNSNNIAFQIVESKRITYDDRLGFKVKDINRNTSTSMKLFHGYTVDFDSENATRTCKMGASPKEITKALDEFCKKQNKLLSNGEVSLRVSRDYKNRVQFSPSYIFNTEKEALAFAKKHGGTYNIINHDDGSQA